MTALQQQARALGDPTRHAIFRYIAESSGGVDVVELTEHFGFNHNAIRQHLAKLVDAELVVQSTAPSSGRGRPRLVYRLDATAESRWDVAGPYERLSLLLSEVIRTGETPVEIGRRATQRTRLGASPLRREDHDPASTLFDEMARGGFSPRHRSGREVAIEEDGSSEIVLENCPFATAALADPDTICGLHLGLAIGVAERTGGLVVDELIPRDPRRAKCILRYHTVNTTIEEVEAFAPADDSAATGTSDPGSSGVTQ